MHAVLPWKAADRKRRTLILRYDLQHANKDDVENNPEARLSPGIRARCAKPTLELMTHAPESTIKAVARMVSQTFPLYTHNPPPVSYTMCIFGVSYRDGCLYVTETWCTGRGPDRASRRRGGRRGGGGSARSRGEVVMNCQWAQDARSLDIRMRGASLWCQAESH